MLKLYKNNYFSIVFWENDGWGYHDEGGGRNKGQRVTVEGARESRRKTKRRWVRKGGRRDMRRAEEEGEGKGEEENGIKRSRGERGSRINLSAKDRLLRDIWSNA